MTKEEYNKLRVGDTIQQMYGTNTAKITKISREPVTQKAVQFVVRWSDGVLCTYGADFFERWVRLPAPLDSSLPTTPGFYWFKGWGKDWYGTTQQISCPVRVDGAIARPLAFGCESISLSHFKGEWAELTEDKIFGGR